jgi:hypothetical protein
LILTQQQFEVVGEIRSSTISERGARIETEAAMEKKTTRILRKELYYEL